MTMISAITLSLEVSVTVKKFPMAVALGKETVGCLFLCSLCHLHTLQLYNEKKTEAITLEPKKPPSVGFLSKATLSRRPS